MTAFRDQMKDEQLAWQARSLPHVTGQGSWAGRSYDHILPVSARLENLWAGIRDDGVRSLPDYPRACR